MGRLIGYMQRKGYRWYWMSRHWWMDTESGREAHVVVGVLSFLVFVAQTVRMAIRAMQPPPPVQQEQAYIWWVVQLIIAIVAAILVYVTMPKPESPKPNEGDTPTTEDGTSILIVDGTVWLKKPFIQANKVLGYKPIKSGGKK